MKVHIIAEAGSNYNGSADLAKSLNSVAADAGADSVKYQIIYPEGLYRPGEYAYGHYDIKDVWKIRASGVLEDDEWRDIAADAIKKNIPFSASVFDTKGLDLLTELNPPYLKIASTDLNNLRFLKEVAERGLPMIVSTGMSTLGDVEKAVAVLAVEGISGSKLVLLHCVSAYPSPVGDTNLSFINTLKAAFGTAVGFSDHTLGHLAACAAVACGATWIEKHFTTDKTLEGFDHKHASEPDEFTAYVSAIREIESALTPKITKIGPAEAYTRERARRGVYASRALTAGHVLTAEDISVVRPQSAISADQANDLVGMKLKDSVDPFAPISWEMFE